MRRRSAAGRATAAVVGILSAVGMGGATVVGIAGAAPAPAEVEVRIRIDSQVPDVDDAIFSAFVIETLNDRRSWASAGFRFVADPASDLRVVLAEPPVVDGLCAPLRTRSQVSCQNGDVVALNAERWRSTTDDWDRSDTEYRQYLVNHEVGHLVGQRHPEPRCPAPGTPAAVMEQQTKGLAGCLGNPWPLPWEIERASSRPAVIAPPPDWAPDPVPVNLGGTATTSAPATSAPAPTSTTTSPPVPTTVAPTSTSAVSTAPESAGPASSSAPAAGTDPAASATNSAGTSDERSGNLLGGVLLVAGGLALLGGLRFLLK